MIEWVYWHPWNLTRLSKNINRWCYLKKGELLSLTGMNSFLWWWEDSNLAQACHLVERFNLQILFVVQGNGKRGICNVEKNGWSLDSSMTLLYHYSLIFFLDWNRCFHPLLLESSIVLMATTDMNMAEHTIEHVCPHCFLSSTAFSQKISMLGENISGIVLQ